MTLAADAWFGGSVDNTPASFVYIMGLSWGPGGKRLHVVRPSIPTFAVLPVALFTNAGADTYRIVNAGSADLTVIGVLGTAIGTLTPGQIADLHLVLPGIEGIWQLVLRSGTATFGASLNDRKAVNIRLTAQLNVNLREYARSAGFIADVPYAVTCTIAEGQVIGSSSTNLPALDTGVWPAGTTIKLLLEPGARICGRGGAGGRGGRLSPSVFSEAGYPGGPAMQVWHDLVVSNHGYIQGGGGGGGGGSFLAPNTPACGGGGGAGYIASDIGYGGFGVLIDQFAAGNGNPGTVGLAGLGGTAAGHSSGGNGGGPGQPGSPGQSLGSALTPAAGGAAGAAILQRFGTSTTWLATGTVDGLVVPF